MNANEADKALITPRGLDYDVRDPLLGRATSCRHFGPLRIDCRLVDKVAQDCEVQAARLDRHGQIYVGGYRCSRRGFVRLPPGASPQTWLQDPVPMLGPGPFDL